MKHTNTQPLSAYCNFVPIKGFEGRYGINKKGEIKTLKFNRLLKPAINIGGYLTVHLGNPSKQYFVHRLIAETFIPNPNKLPQINHKDGKKRNNDIDNLEWCDRSYNTKHAYAMGLIKSWNKGRTGVYSQETLQRMREAQKDVPRYHLIGNQHARKNKQQTI